MINLAIGLGVWLFIEWINVWPQVDRKGRKALVQAALLIRPWVTQWAVADQGASGWDVIGRGLTITAVTVIAVNLWPKRFGVEPL